jgi:xanthine dehydrogenase YagR molybdenum-binding subunit
VRLRRIVSAFAAGRVLNAKTARSQYLGGVVWGSAWLCEYLLPVHTDVRDIDIVMVEEDGRRGSV